MFSINFRPRLFKGISLYRYRRALLMPPPKVPAALAGKAAAAVAGLAYLNARFSIGQDLNFLLGRRAAFSVLTKTGEY